MDDQTRGQLLVTQERLQKQVAQTRSTLTTIGQELEKFGRDLQREPQRVTFSNAPENLGSMPVELAFSAHASYEWGIAKRVEQAAQLIQDLRAQERELSNVQGRLQSGY